ncbi:MAG: NapC/NirT family cytochrome c [Burkholderiales bacterium]|jgi:cytochrome c-type protein NapC|nr:NapC/NirT family cytochrome c [Burkholderiales bacterium]
MNGSLQEGDVSMKKKIVWLWLILGIIVGAAGLATMNFAISATSTDKFCLSCHANDAGKEWMESKHFSNPYGVRVGCADCHMPKEFVPGMMRKMKASYEVYAHLTGTINTPEKFEAKRMHLAESEWGRMKANGAKECKNCHHMDTVNNPEKEYLKDMHVGALEGGQICTDCHKGVAHKAPE